MRAVLKSEAAALDAVHLVAFREQELGEVGSVLAGDAGDEGFLQRFQSPWRFYFRVQIGLVPPYLFLRKVFILLRLAWDHHCKVFIANGLSVKYSFVSS